MLSYTSGTTGDPKGVKITHKMILSGAHALNCRVLPLTFDESDATISYLPAAHVFE